MRALSWFMLAAIVGFALVWWLAGGNVPLVLLAGRVL
jgi:hypothetical protein